MVSFFIFFALLSVVHLYACYFHLDKLRMATKPLLLLSLALFYAFRAEPMRWTVLLALVCGMAGDIFLLWPGREKCFTAGACIFSLGHILYAITVFSFLRASGATFGPWVVLLVALPYVATVAAASVCIIPHIKKTFMKISMPLYFGLVALVNACAWFALIHAARTDAGNVFSASLLVVGGILFFTSDVILANGIFIGEKNRTNFLVMLTYTAAQFCLCLGFIRLP